VGVVGAMRKTSSLTKSQVNRLGDRLRKGNASEEDRKLLDQYRLSFTDAYEAVVGRIRDQLGLEPTGRPAKTTKAIIEKLRREKTRLAEMQDIAGCRVITKTLLDQDKVVAQLQQMFSGVVIDRRYRPSHGYRAVHVVVEQFEKLIEVQIRTSLQHNWAEFSEKLSDEFGHAIKYGGGNEEISSSLAKLSDAIFGVEEAVDTNAYDKLVTHTKGFIQEMNQLLNIVKESGKQ
jgi:putative GTP pyrophosphokinase